MPLRANLPITEHLVRSKLLVGLESLPSNFICETSTGGQDNFVALKTKPESVLVRLDILSFRETVPALVCERLTKDGHREGILLNLIHGFADVEKSATIRAATITIIPIVNVI